MPDRRIPADAELLPEALKERVLKRASELDAARGAATRVGDLRAAATEAGISQGAFDEAMAELAGLEGQAVAKPARRRSPMRSAVIGAVGALGLLIATFVVLRMAMPVPANQAVTYAVVEQSFVLRCMSPHDAMTLIRNRMPGLREGRMWTTSESRILTVVATPADMDGVRQLLEREDGAGSAACAVKPAP